MVISSVQQALTFDDVILLPQHSSIGTRSVVDISTKVGTLELKVPIFSANMDTITGWAMATAMGEGGAAGILHRFCSKEEVISSLITLKNAGHPAIPSVGANALELEVAREYLPFTDTICLDIAHGDSRNACKAAEYLQRLGFKNIIAGNVCTGQGALALWNHGATVVKVGVAPGAVCTTKFVTGHGRPQLTAIMDVADTIRLHSIKNLSVIADGGIKNSGDIVKALAAGADAVMVGRLFAGTTESLGGTAYRGMASREAQMDFRGKVSNDAPEGREIQVERRGFAGDVLKELAGGIRSGLSYSDARSLMELRHNAIFERVTVNYGLNKTP